MTFEELQKNLRALKHLSVSISVELGSYNNYRTKVNVDSMPGGDVYLCCTSDSLEVSITRAIQILRIIDFEHRLEIEPSAGSVGAIELEAMCKAKIGELQAVLDRGQE